LHFSQTSVSRFDREIDCERFTKKEMAEMATNTTSAERRNLVKNAETFRELHKPAIPLVLYNVWDAGSARAVATSGAKAIATSSWAVAKAHGFDDGEQIPFELAMQNLLRIVGAVDLPVSVDLESGYGEAPKDVAKSVSLAIEAGAVGCNLEDRIPATGAVRDSAAQADRIRSARQAAKGAGIPFFINARCDLFFQGNSVPHDQELLAMAAERARLYKEAGADGFFVPGLTTISLISELVKISPIPVNILADSSTSIQVLAANGVARVSYGATPYVELIGALERTARAITG
jgi:2-methylisocitrate lyase-like PEP mutase family enzyme